MATVITFADGSKLLVDAALRHNHEMRNEVTDHPRENTADVTDNIRPKARTFTIEGVISATPLVNPGEDPPINPHAAAFHKLEAATARRQPIGISTGLKVYTQLAIEVFTCPREPRTGVDLFFTLQLKEIIVATTGTATVPKGALGTGTPAAVKATQNRHPKRVHRGLRQPTAATAAQATATKRAATNAASKPAPKLQSWALQGAKYLMH
jgi:hypothetical protein